VNLPPAVEAWCLDQGHGAVTARRPVGGGCINQGAQLETKTGATFFLKQNASAAADMFACEAAGLEALRLPGGPRLPQTLLVGEHFLLLEDMRPSPRQPSYWTDLGRQLANLHGQTRPLFGFEHDNYLGSTPQPNPETDDGYAFFADHRLRFQGQSAADRGLLDRPWLDRLDRLADRLPELVPPQPASLLHGDLWSGNAISGPSGEPVLIDPAAHCGWAEAELGMTALFGGFPEAFYQAYHSSRPLAAGWRQRLPIYNLYHLLNHLNLFGTSYLGQVQSILNRYGH